MIIIRRREFIHPHQDVSLLVFVAVILSSLQELKLLWLAQPCNTEARDTACIVKRIWFPWSRALT